MTYQVEQTRGDNTYVYEVNSYWNTEKGQPRQKRRYLGKRDPLTGEITTPRKGFHPRAARDFGNVYLLKHIAAEIGLSAVLCEAFPDLAMDLLNLACFQISEADPLYLFKPWAERTHLDDEPRYLTSQRISELLENLGVMTREQDEFFRLWIRRQGDIKAVFFDITSLSSYSKLIDLLEWGYNRDGDSLPQINFGVAVGQPSNLPLTYRMYQGSIPDVSTLKNTLCYLEPLGVRNVTLVLDRGFYSQANLGRMDGAGMTFIIPMSFSTKLTSTLISKNARVLSSPLNAFRHGNKPVFHVKREITIGELRLDAHLYHDEKRRADQLERLMGRLLDVEDNFLGQDLKHVRHANAHLKEVAGKLSGYFKVTTEDGIIGIKRKPKTISRILNRMGKTILLTNESSFTRELLLLLYRRKDVLEKLFDILKNELDEGRLRVKSREAMEGRLFLNFIAIILYSALSNVMKEKDLFKKYCVKEILAELKKLRIVEMSNGKSYLTVVSKRQRELYKKFGVPIPTEA